MPSGIKRIEHGVFALLTFRILLLLQRLQFHPAPVYDLICEYGAEETFRDWHAEGLVEFTLLYIVSNVYPDAYLPPAARLFLRTDPVLGWRAGPGDGACSVA